MTLKSSALGVCAGLFVLSTRALGSDSQFKAHYAGSWLAYDPGPGYTGQSYEDTQIVHNGTAFREAGTSEASTGNNGNWSALAIAGPGLVRLSVSANATSTGFNSNATMNSSVLAELDDFFTPMSSNPSDLGKEVTVTGSFAVAGYFTASENGHTVSILNANSGSGGVSLSASGTGMETSPYGDNTFGRMVRQTDTDPVDEPLVTSIHVTLTGHIGQEMEMHDTFILGGGAQTFNNLAPAPTSVTATFDGELLHTVAWAGVSSAVDSSGHAFDGFSMVSANTGIDYAQAVPEPTTYLALGIGFIGCLRRRRR